MEHQTRVRGYPGFYDHELAGSGSSARGPQGLSSMQQLVLTADQGACIDSADAPGADTLMMLPLTEAKRLAAAEFERRYLVRVMARAGGSVSGGRPPLRPRPHQLSSPAPAPRTPRTVPAWRGGSVRRFGSWVIPA